ncbi:MAG: D-glycero-beta-D-manno-heptose 1,7-bisphosphate 7-phosphatase [Desulfobacteria bacterium]
MKIVFMDRDGIINKDRRDYVKSWSEFEFLPKSLDALKLLRLNGYHIILVTNQSVINRRMVTEAGLKVIHEKMTRAVVDHGGSIEAVYYCPHVPEDGCGCRKPEPGLIYRAQADYGLDLSSTCMIGDSFKDIGCARRAGCGRVILVRTGHGKEAEHLCQEADIKPDHVADDLMTAVEWLLNENSELKAES